MSLIPQNRSNEESFRSEEKIRNYNQDYGRRPNLWTAVVLVSIFINFFLASFSYVFLKNLDYKIFYIILILDIIYVLDFLISVRYFWRRSTLMSRSQPLGEKLILIIDFFLAFPASYIYEGFSYSSYNYYIFISLRAVMIFRLFHFVLYFKHWTPAGINSIKWFMVKYLLFLMVLIHVTSCIWYLSVFPENSTSKWTKVEDFREIYESSFEKYTVSFYYVLTILLNRNFGDFLPGTITEKILSISFMSVGFISTTAIFIAMLSFILDFTHKRRTDLKMEVQNVSAFLKSISAKIVNQKLIRDYYKILWIKKMGVYDSSQFARLPASLKSEICVDVSIDFLQTCTIFHDKSDAFLRMVSNLIKHEFYQKGELIYCRNVVKNKMIFVVAGTIEVLSAEDDESPIITLGAGTCLGESSLVLSTPARTSVRTASYTELQVLHRKEFFTLMDFFPQECTAIHGIIIERITNAQTDQISEEESIELNPFLQKHNVSVTKTLKDSLKKGPEEKNRYLSLYQIKQSEEINEKSVCLSAKFPWIIHPDSSLRQFWECWVIVVILYISVSYPYYIIFLKTYPVWFSFSYNFVDLFFVIDLVIILTTAIDENEKIVKTFTKISQTRLTQFGFYLDFFSCIKTELFYWIWTRNRRFEEVLRLNRLLKIYRIPKLLRKTENKIDFNSHLLFLLKYVFYLLLSTYWCGGIFYLVTCFEDLCYEDGWYFTRILNNLQQQVTTSFITHEVFTSMYFSLSCLSGLTPGDLLPTNITELKLTSFVLICGFFFFGCCVAQYSAFLTRRIKPYANFQDRFFSTLTFMKETRDMEKDNIERIKNYLVLQWHYDKASVLKNRPIFFNISKDIQTRIQMDEKMEIVTSISLFQGQTLDFLLLLATKAKTLLVPPNEYVTYKGEVLKMLYIIKAGYCERQFEKSSVVIGPTSFFGTMCLFCNVNSLCSVRTLTQVQLFYISEDDFWKTASICPRVVTQFKQAMKQFDLLTVFKNIRIPTIANIEEDTAFRGSFVNVVSYCRKHNENYTQPYRELGILCFVQAFILPICIFPFGSFLKLWMKMRLLVAIIITILTPHQIIQMPYSFTLDKILFAMDIISYIDLYTMMFVGYYGNKKQLVIHPLKTSVHYIKGRFILDAIFCFPWELLVFYFNERNQEKPVTQNILQKIPNLVKMIRIGQIYRLFQFLDYRTNIERKVNRNGHEVFKFFCVALILLHILASILVANTCGYFNQNDLAEYTYNESFVKPEGLAHHSAKSMAMYCNEDSWIDRSIFRNFTTPYQVYIAATYFCSQLLSSGLGDITPQYLSTLIVVIIIKAIFLLFTGYVYARISSNKTHQNCLLFKNREMMSEMKRFMKQELVPERLSNQIIERIEHQWKRYRGVEPKDILSKTHPLLYEDTLYTMYEATLAKAPIFENVDPTFFRLFGKLIKEKCYLRQETIYTADDIISDLCIIERGLVRIVSKSGHMDAFLETGSLFGNFTPDAKHKMLINVTALSNVGILCIDSGEFYAAMKNFSSVRNLIEKNITRRTDFIISPSTSSDLSIDMTLYPETPASSHTFRSLSEFKTSVLRFLLICLPWKLFRVVIPHYSGIFAYFDIYCLILNYISAVLVVYEFAFQHHTMGLLGYAIYADATFVLKILLEVHKTYENRYGEMVTSNSKIIIKYFEKHKIRKIVNLIVNFPFYYLVFVTAAFTQFDSYKVFSTLRMITLYRLFYFVDYYEEKYNQLTSSTLKLKLSAIFVWGTLIIHCFACGWYFCACPFYSCHEDSWVNHLFNTTSIDNSNKMEIYVTTVYFMVTLLTKTGVGDVVAFNIQEQIFTLLVMISAIFFIAVFIGEIWNFLNSIKVSHVKYEDKMKELKQNLQNNRISKYQMKKICRYGQQLWRISGGDQMPSAIELLHSATFQELMLEIYGYHLKNSYVFSEMEESFISQLCQYLKRTLFFPGNYIVQHGDFDETMYFIHFGEVEILSVHSNLTESVHEVLHTGDMFGVLQGLFHNVPHHFSFRARTTVHIVSLRLSDWEHLLDFFPESKESIFTKTNRVNV